MAHKPTFQLRLVGVDVAPETVAASDLADFMKNIEAAIAAARPEESGPLSPDDPIVSLVRIEPGNDRLTFAVIGSAMLSVRAISAAIETGDYSHLPPATHQKIHNISKQALRKGWAVEFVPDEKYGIKAAAISPDNPVLPPQSAKVSGPTTISGRLMRVDGARLRGELRLPNGDILDFDLDEAMAEQIRDGLYEDVSIEGVATWTLEDRDLVDFKATRITNYRPARSDLVQAFAELAAAAKGRWDDVDVERFVHDLRAGD